MSQVTVKWDASGKPYYDIDGRNIGYVPPASALESTNDPRLMAWGQAHAARPGQSFLKDSGTWNPATGQYDQGINWTNILSSVVGAGLGAGAIGALAGGGTAGAASIPTDVAGLSGVGAVPAAAGGVGVGAGEIGATTGLGTAAGTVAGPGASAIGGSSFGNALLGLVGGKSGALSAGLNLVSAALSSNASKDAAKTQSDAAQKAIDQLGPMYAPYQQAGQQSLGRLNGFLGGGQNFQQPTPAPLPNGWQPNQPPQQAGGTIGSMGAVNQQPDMQMRQGGMPAAGQSSMVTLKAPDGSTRQVPQQSAQSMIQASGGRLQMVQ